MVFSWWNFEIFLFFTSKTISDKNIHTIPKKKEEKRIKFELFYLIEFNALKLNKFGKENCLTPQNNSVVSNWNMLPSQRD